VRAKLPLDGNAAAFFKTVGELAVHAGELAKARALFAEAAPILREVRPRVAAAARVLRRKRTAIDARRCRRGPWTARTSLRSAMKSSP
jgi:hypothetical protein